MGGNGGHGNPERRRAREGSGHGGGPARLLVGCARSLRPTPENVKREKPDTDAGVDVMSTELGGR